MVSTVPTAELVMVQDVLRKLTARVDLTAAEAYGLIMGIKDGRLSDIQIAGFLAALSTKGPTVTEIAAIARAMRDNCSYIRPKVSGQLIDTCGTGGGKTTFNISTVVAIVASAAGIPVAKHGSRSLSSLSGSADVLEILGVEINLEPAAVEAIIEQIGIGFMYAPLFHPIMHRVLPSEQELGVKTIFYTIIGPLINPAGASAHILGVYKPELVDIVAEVASHLDYQHLMVVHGLDGLDEISLLGETYIAELRAGAINKYCVTPEQFGLQRCTLEEITAGTPVENAAILKAILSGAERGPKRDAVVINAAGALVVGQQAANLAEGVKLAAAIIDEGKAYQKLQELIGATQQAKRLAS
jgi:anthranilate phosphoribosyltransferase